MAIKIVIDAGHGGTDPGAVYQNRLEKDDNLALALAVGEILEGQGYEVVYTRTEDVYDSPSEKARIANRSGADYFVSIHRNSTKNDNTLNGVQTLVYDDSGIKAVMARNINSELEKVGYRNINVSERPNLTVLRRTNMPAVLVEAGFINSDVDNSLFDNSFSQTAEAIARGIDETINMSAVAVSSQIGYGDRGGTADENSVSNDEGSDYQILVGIYRDFSTASDMLRMLLDDGYDAEIYEDDGLFQLRVGNYENEEAARKSNEELRERGYSTLLVRAL